jgi:hypothetical protein
VVSPPRDLCSRGATGVRERQGHHLTIALAGSPVSHLRSCFTWVWVARTTDAISGPRKQGSLWPTHIACSSASAWTPYEFRNPLHPATCLPPEERPGIGAGSNPENVGSGREKRTHKRAHLTRRWAHTCQACPNRSERAHSVHFLSLIVRPSVRNPQAQVTRTSRSIDIGIDTRSLREPAPSGRNGNRYGWQRRRREHVLRGIDMSLRANDAFVRRTGVALPSVTLRQRADEIRRRPIARRAGRAERHVGPPAPRGDRLGCRAE